MKEEKGEEKERQGNLGLDEKEEQRERIEIKNFELKEWGEGG